MAEKVANFTLTLDARPSLFEVIAQKSLNDTLYDAIHKLVQVTVQLRPNRLNDLLRYYPETYLILNGLLQYYYLKKYNASFGEHFYNLQRIHAKCNRFNQRDKLLSFVIIVILPYLYKRINLIAGKYELDDVDGLLDNSFKSKTKRFLYRSNSLINVSWFGWLLINYLRYSANQTVYSSPELYLIQTKLIYSNDFNDNTGFWSSLFRRQLSFKEAINGLVENSLKSCVELGAFLIQFLNVWQSEENNQLFDLNNLPIVQPSKDNNVCKGKCPICLQSCKIPTVLPVSGYVFCFWCIMNHLKESETCPVSNLPANNLDLIRLYDI